MEENGLTVAIFLIVPIARHQAAAYRQKISSRSREASSNRGGVEIAVARYWREEATMNMFAESVPQSQGGLCNGVVERVDWTLRLWT